MIFWLTLYAIFAIGALFVQALTFVEGLRHIRFTLRKLRPPHGRYQPRVALIAPCKGLDTAFDENIRSFLAQDYPAYDVLFVVESTDDPAYNRLVTLIDQHRAAGRGPSARLIVAGHACQRGQKVHNLLAACDAAPSDAEVFAFVDSDACLKPHFLGALVHPLRRTDVGAATGYRWFVPTDRTLASRVTSALNASVASLLGPHPWNSAWGGATAIKRFVFEQTHLADAWAHAASDDYVLTATLRRAHLPIEFVPACFVASYLDSSWRDSLDFFKRQFILTWASMRRLWFLGVAGWGHLVLALFGGIAVFALLAAQGSPLAPWAAILPAAVWANGTFKAIARQLVIRRILPEHKRRLRSAALVDVLLWPFVITLGLICLLATTGRRTLHWRGITYRLLDDRHAEVLPAPADPAKPSL